MYIYIYHDAYIQEIYQQVLILGKNCLPNI